MSEIRALKRVKKCFKDIYSTAQAFNDQTKLQDCLAQLDILESTYKEFLVLEENVVVNDENDKTLEEMASLHNAARKKLLSTQHALSSSKDDQTCANASITELCSHQNAILKEILNMNKRDNDLQLPGTKIPPFNGNSYSEYQSFKNLFDSIVDSNENIPVVRKLQILKGLCKDKAYNLIKHVEIDELNYEPTVKLLDERFGRSKQILTTYLKRFLEQPTIVNPSAKSFHQMYDTSMEILNGVKTLGDAAQNRDPWIILILLNKLDAESRLAWANESNEKEFPTSDEFLKFLAKRGNNMEISNSSSFKPVASKTKVMQMSSSSQKTCLNCKGEHNLYECKEFSKMSVHDRRGFVADNRLCFNCLFGGHHATTCRSTYKCKKCHRRHHYLLHVDNDAQTATASKEEKRDVGEGPSSKACTSTSNGLNIQAILPTVGLQIEDASGQSQNFRALIDSGAQNSLVTERCVQNLAIPRRSTNISISGIGGHVFKAKGIVKLSVKSRYDPKEVMEIFALIVPKLPPIEPLECKSVLKAIHHLQLADSNILTESTCDLLIGADKCFSILRPGQHTINGGILVQNTMFGWILAGGSTLNENNETSICSSVIENNYELEEILKRFWAIEELCCPSPISPKDEYIEEFFRKTTQFSDGRFTARIPFKMNAEKLGDSLSIATKRFYAIERKMQSNPAFKKFYVKGINDYLHAGHMILTPWEEINRDNSEVYYLPHHPVFKEESETTKVRIVFDGSCKTSNGLSLNEIMLVGPTIQASLWEILMRFRIHPIVITADIQKMYLQINMHENDQRYQRLLWRENPNDELKHYQLTTVTFGLASSPYIATRALLQIAINNKHLALLAKEIENSFYVDDYISGTDTVENAIDIKSRLTDLLQSYGFKLHKWKSNSEYVCGKEDVNQIHSFENSTTKVLGLQWCPKSDSFSFNVQLKEHTKLTKRKLLSESAQVYDPLGWLAPTVVLFKMLYQKTWMMKLDWDQDLPKEIASDYLLIRNELPCFQNLQFPRHMQFCDKTELHGFSDASERAYGAVIYARTVKDDETYSILVTSKTKISPTKPMSIARLELCAAHLLAKLMNSTKRALNLTSDPFLWTDSKVVLAWLSEHPSQWKTFVANRCVQIQEEFPRRFWSYVPTKENPADYASRGVKPSNLLSLKQWWHGPEWLSQLKLSDDDDANLEKADENLEKERKALKSFILTTGNEEKSIIEQLFERFSKFETIRRTLANVFKFISKLKTRRNLSREPIKMVNCLEDATKLMTKWSQNEFCHEIQELKTYGEVKGKSSIASLYPFLDDDGIIRVGGRLKNANVNVHQKHPAIIPKNHILGKVLIWHYHFKNLHCGPTLTLQILQQRFWLIHGRSMVRKELRNCVLCFKHKPSIMQQLMGQLPAERVNLTRAFYNTGVDYAGPFDIASKTGRGAKLIKAYIAIFVCMSTKAVHLEAVSDLTTTAFLATLTRFVSRRGVPHTIHSDNAKNFVGAKNKLNELYNLVVRKDFNDFVSEKLSEQGIHWNFITPLAPHEGGLWEAAVKSVKSLLLKTSRSYHFTFEELTTMLCKIEAILNSRPLSKTCSDDVEYNVLTPNHFLNGTPSNLIVEDELHDIPQNRLDRWQIVQQQTQYFWRQYQREYINALQQRLKWVQSAANLSIGDIVLLQDEQQPSYKWPLAKVIETYPDSEGKVRQVLVKTSNSELKRSIRKLCKIPMS